MHLESILASETVWLALGDNGTAILSRFVPGANFDPEDDEDGPVCIALSAKGVEQLRAALNERAIQ